MGYFLGKNNDHHDSPARRQRLQHLRPVHRPQMLDDVRLAQAVERGVQVLAVGVDPERDSENLRCTGEVPLPANYFSNPSATPAGWEEGALLSDGLGARKVRRRLVRLPHVVGVPARQGSTAQIRKGSPMRASTS